MIRGGDRVFNKKIKASFILINLLILFIFANSLMHYKSFQYVSNNDNSYSTEDNLKFSNGYNDNLIILFNGSSYNSTVISRFEYYGGVVTEEWNSLFTTFSGFSGIMPSEQNKTVFQNEFPDANIENNEIIITQMNYASIQTGSLNATWFPDGYKGDTNCSIAVLDTGIDPSHEFFPNGYNPIDFQGNIVGWENLINTDPVSDDNGHGTFISSIISGTGPNTYSPNQYITVKIKHNYSHTALFDEFSPSKNYSLKVFSFNASVPNSRILINSSWNLEESGIDDFWIELFHDNTLVGYSHNINTDINYTINYTLPQSNLGIYDLYIKYHKELQSNPIFSYNTSISYYSEFYIEKYNSSGEFIWNLTWGRTGWESYLDLNFDSFDNLFLLCSSYNLTSREREIFLIKNPIDNEKSLEPIFPFDQGFYFYLGLIIASCGITIVTLYFIIKSRIRRIKIK